MPEVMDEIPESVVQISLFIKQGRGFGSIQHPLCVEASLDGHFLGTQSVSPAPEPYFGEELTWLVDKKRLRRLRTTTSHIKLNCYTLIGPHERETVGFLMLGLRCAQIQTNKRPEVTQTWHKLMGSGTARPELLLSYSVRSAASQLHRMPNAATLTMQEMMRCGGDHVDVAPHLHSEQEMIQIGPASVGNDVFLLTILVGQISNLHLLLHENLGSQHGKKFTFHFCYTVCGHTIHTKNFTVDPATIATIQDNEKLVIRIRSSLRMLKEYFDCQSVMPCLLMLGNEEVASTSVDLKTLVPTESLEEFCSRHMTTSDGIVQKSQCLFTSAKTQQVPVGEDGSKPSVNVVLMFKFVERQVVPITGLGTDVSRTYTLLKDHRSIDTAKEVNMLQELCTNSFSAPEFVTNPESNKHSESPHTEQSEAKQSCVSDQPVLDNVPRETAYLLPQHNGMSQVERAHKKNLSESKSQETVLSHAGCGDVNQQPPLEHLVRSTAADKGDALHRYDLTIVVESVHFQRVFSEEKVFFKFYHPNAEMACSRNTEVLVHNVGEDLPLHGVFCKLGFHSTPGQIGHLLLASLPRVVMCSRTTGEQTLVLASTTLDTAPLLCADKGECCFSKGLRNISTREQVAVVKVSMLLEDVGVQMMSGDAAGRKFAGYRLGTATPSEVAMFRVVEELEDWKEKQQEIFRAELREKETAHLALLMDEWYLKRTEIEVALKKDVDECSKMKEDLERAQEDLRLGIEKIAKREKEVQLLKEKVQSEWARKRQELEDIGAKMEHDVEKELQLRAEKTAAEQNVTSLQQEVKLWQDTARLREAELEEEKKNKLTTESAKYLFQELETIGKKLNDALKLKSFYKEQWTRAMKEILRLKTEHREGLQISVPRDDVEQLKNQGAVKTLQETEAAKKEDQNILKEIKEKANKSWLSLPKLQETSNATTSGSQSMSSVLSSAQKSHSFPEVDKMSTRDVEQALHSMITERDCMLGTGNYSLDDDFIIRKLNEDIRMLMAKLES